MEFAKDIIDVLKNMTDPRPGLVTREPFDVEKLAITQFPALLIVSGDEERSDYSMGVTRQGTIIYTIRGFVRGTEIDKLRQNSWNNLQEYDYTSNQNSGSRQTCSIRRSGGHCSG